MAKNFFAKVGCRSLVFESKVLCVSVMDMVIPAPFSLKMDGRIGGLNLNGKKMRTQLESGISLLVNGMETLMTKIAEDMKPPEPLAKVLTLLSRVMPKAKLVPQKDLAELEIRDLKKRKLITEACLDLKRCEGSYL